jgi:uncharacterized protein (TIGR03086 family)
MNDPVQDCGRAVDVVGPVVAQVAAADLDRPTPCAQWDVRALVEHLIWMCDVFAAGLAGADPPGAPVPLGDDDPMARYTVSSAAALQGWQTTEWADMMLALPFSTLPAAIGVRVFVGDQLIHGWDLATALGRTFAMPADLAAAQLEMMRQYYDPANRGPEAAFSLATDCPPDASAQDQLLALSGRSPGVGLGPSGR